MNRREFLNYSLPATGAVLLVPGLAKAQLMNEINRHFTDDVKIEEYDIIINGAGLSGYFAAIEARKRGYKVLIVERRASPGFEITAKRKLWIKNKDHDKWDTELNQLFFPDQEQQEIFNLEGAGSKKSLFDDEFLLFAGSIKKGMLRNLLINDVHVLLMTDVCGIITDEKNVSGVLLACKHGLFTVKCKAFIDSSDNLLFTRNLIKQNFQIEKASFVVELLEVAKPQKKTIKVSEELGLVNNEIYCHKGKSVNHQLFMEFYFIPDSQNIEAIEAQSRFIAGNIGRNFKELDHSLKDAKVHYYAYESSLFLNNSTPSPSLNLDGYYTLNHGQEEFDCTSILDIKNLSCQSISRLILRKNVGKQQFLLLEGNKISLNQISRSNYYEKNLSVQVEKVDNSIIKIVPTTIESQIVIGGAGTSGVTAAIGASEMGADVVAIDYFNDLGGTKTLGGVMGYYHGMRDNKYLVKLDSDSDKLSSEINFNKKPGRQYYFLKLFAEQNVVFLSGAIICSSIVENNKVKGILICRNGKLEKILGDVVIDSTGDGDIAYFSGAETSHGNTRNGITQNYSQWNLIGGGKSPSNVNSDYDIIDNTKISELQRGLFLSHYEAHFYDFHPYLTVRESRRVKGIYELNLIDAVEATHFDDLISVASSDYDPHFVGYSEYTRCGFLLPHSNIVKVEIPYRSLIPKGLNGIIVIGKAFSQTHNTFQFTRMAADLTVLGYHAGQVSAKAVRSGINLKDLDIKDLQSDWYNRGFIPKEFANKKVGNSINDEDEINFRVKNLREGKEEFLYECCKLRRETVITKLKENFNSISSENGKLLTAKALAWFGESLGNDLIIDELSLLFKEEKENGYPNGYIETYDDIRGREKNVIKGLFWKINQNIALLAMANNNKCVDIIQFILENTTSGGTMVPRESDYYNERIDLRIIPFYNRIVNLCFYADRVPNQKLIFGFEKLLTDENICGYLTDKYQDTRWKVYGAILEVSIASALARCGSKKGYQLLANYLNDIHFNLSDFAATELSELTGKKYNTDANYWNQYFNTMLFPQPCKKLIKEIEM